MNDNGTADDLRQIARRAMLDRGLEPEFPPDVLRQLDGISGLSPEVDGARDLRHLPWCSIDNDDSKDLDQLTVAEPLADGRVRVLVAIADVDALVRPATPIDRHAGTNTTSVYTPACIFPMLPARLSTDLTSLAEDRDRPAVVIGLAVAPDGSVGESEAFRALVRNRAKLAYRGVGDWLDGRGPLPERAARIPGLKEQLRMQDRTAAALRAVRHAHGALEFETIEPEVVFEGGRVRDLRVDSKNRAKELIEDLMIAANTATARYLERRGVASLRRVVRAPAQWDRIRQVAREHGASLPAAPDAKALAEFLAASRRKDPLRFPDLSLTVIKLLGPGEYVVQAPGAPPVGHFGLAVRDYGHSTAPNRRFADLITQRLLKAAIDGRSPPYSAAEHRRAMLWSWFPAGRRRRGRFLEAAAAEKPALRDDVAHAGTNLRPSRTTRSDCGDTDRRR